MLLKRVMVAGDMMVVMWCRDFVMLGMGLRPIHEHEDATEQWYGENEQFQYEGEMI